MSAAEAAGNHRAVSDRGRGEVSSTAPRHPLVVANRTEERRLEVIAALRRLRMTGAEIAECLGMAPSTVSGP